jgi:hypothetical protein
MRSDVREAVRTRFTGHCGYCGLHENEAGARLTIDHFQPVSRGGSDDLENLVYACHNCNTFKSDYWSEDDTHVLLHPLHDDLSLHLVESITSQMVPLTERGMTYITVLHLNRPELIQRRRIKHRQEISTAVLTELSERFTRLETEIKRLQAQLSD